VSGTAKVKVFLSGEGRNELGSRSGDPVYQSDEEPGVLHALLTRVRASGWEVGGACNWRKIRKYRASAAPHEDTHNVLGIALDATEAGCEVLAFSRDVDNDSARQQAVDDGLALIPQTFADAPGVIGGVAVPKLEGWILALLGVRGTEALSPKRAEQDLAVKSAARKKDGRAMVRIVEDADLARIPPDAASLHTWLDRARAVLPPACARRAGG
jgi:hypothetical protein